MKAKISNLLLLFMLLPAIALAGGEKGKYTKEKKISKSYIVNSNMALDITNKYGNIYVTTWDEDKTAIDIVIRVSADKETRLNERLNSIDVDLEATRSLVKAMTKIGNFRGKASVEINYTIKIPKKGSIKLTNQYGGITVGKIYSKAEINCQYGDLNIEELNSDNNIVNIQYCGSSKMGYFKSGSLAVGYSNINILRAGRIQAVCEYTDLKIGDIDDLTYRCDYGNLQISNGNKITGTSSYMSSKINKVNTLLNLTSNYGDLQVSNITKGVHNVAINATYTGISLKYAPDYSFDFEVKVQYDRLEGGNDLKFQEKREKSTEGYYKGYHKNSGINRIFIKSEYGHVSLKQV